MLDTGCLLCVTEIPICRGYLIFLTERSGLGISFNICELRNIGTKTIDVDQEFGLKSAGKLTLTYRKCLLFLDSHTGYYINCQDH